MPTKTNLKSTVTVKGRYVSQILHFINGEKRTFNDVDTHSIKQGQFTKFETKDGRLVMVNDKNILCIEIITEKDDK
jgi:hypothetical protein|tara:strand:+ start:470 stop:697 length:228 start_codon:yes stop_codon:yes gene_type:complete